MTVVGKLIKLKVTVRVLGRCPKYIKSSSPLGKVPSQLALWFWVKSSQASYSKSICRCLAGVEGLREESCYENASRFEVNRPFSRGSASRERGKKGRRLRPLISSGVVRSLLTQHYWGERGFVFQNAKVQSYYQKPLLEHRPNEVNILREVNFFFFGCLTTQQMRNAGADGFKIPGSESDQRPCNQSFLGISS